MHIHYKIVEVWPSDHLIVVRYWTDVVSEQFLANSEEYFDDGSPRRCRSDVSITLPTPTPAGKDLEDIIMRNAPSYWLKTLEDVMDPFVDTSMHDMGLHGFKIHAILEVVQLGSYANATQDPGIVGSKKKCGVGL